MSDSNHRLMRAMMGEVMFEGRPRRTKTSHPYSYDPIVTWLISGVQPDGSVYSDRLFQWDSAKHDRLCEKHFKDRSQWWDARNADRIEAFLREYLNLPALVLCEIQEQCNVATGYPVWFFAFRKEGASVGPVVGI